MKNLKPHTFKCVSPDPCDDLTVGKHYVSHVIPHIVWGTMERIIDDVGDERPVNHLLLSGILKQVPAIKSKYHEREEMQQMFIDFLKEKKVFNEFVVNLATVTLTCPGRQFLRKKTLSELFEKIYISQWIQYSFIWMNSPQQESWSSLDEDWKKIVVVKGYAIQTKY